MPKYRPAVLLTPTDLIAQSDPLLIMGISSSYYPGNDGVIPLQYRADGNTITRLTKDSAACVNLIQSAKKSDLEWRGGSAPPEYLIDILEAAKR
jgi:mRNA-degrading endonuclease toxin of MazEF toxin-antitoxin module